VLHQSCVIAGETRTLSVSDRDYISLLETLYEKGPEQVIAVLQRSLADQLAPYEAWRWVLWMVFAVGLLLSVLMAVMIARSATKPVLELARSAQRIREGDYEQRVEVAQRDELGKLADSFNEMAVGLAEKERVRNLLGKVVSPEIAEELLSKEIELGGEERVITVLFSDARNFTSLCEGRAPRDILSLLNRYLTEITGIIEEHGGVVDKYIGDAVMALFGAPLQRPDSASQAVAAALGMDAALQGVNACFRAEGIPELGVGIGLNTGLVVAGNMGSELRLNYTVIGDGVNLASRLEGLTKHYGVTVVVSTSTRDAAPEFLYRDLDQVRVKGKQEAVGLFQPLVLRRAATAERIERVDIYHEALALYRQREWTRARASSSAPPVP